MKIEEYKRLYDESINDPEKFWGTQAERLHWFKKWDKVKNTSFTKPVQIEWFEGAELNVSYNCIDRHLEKRGDKVALMWESDSPDIPSKKVTYKQLHKEVCKFANVLKKNGVKRGDRVTIYMPMILEGAYAMLACARIGAMHSVIFGGFAPDSIADRILNCESDFVITADEGFRGSKTIPLKKNIDAALARTPGVRNVLVIKHSGNEVGFKTGRDLWYHDEVETVDAVCEPEKMSAEDPLFLLYTSGSTGKPKGVLHTTGGYLLYASLTHQHVFDLQENDVYWCTADIGWVTGHSY
ncbi:MAG: acetyl-coenzyme A synthetase, partial [Proteobacteria bacterium]